MKFLQFTLVVVLLSQAFQVWLTTQANVQRSEIDRLVVQAGTNCVEAVRLVARQ